MLFLGAPNAPSTGFFAQYDGSGVAEVKHAWQYSLKFGWYCLTTFDVVDPARALAPYFEDDIAALTPTRAKEVVADAKSHRKIVAALRWLGQL